MDFQVLFTLSTLTLTKLIYISVKMVVKKAGHLTRCFETKYKTSVVVRLS